MSDPYSLGLGLPMATTAIYVPSVNNEADPFGVRGLGEKPIVGVALAVANAVFNAKRKSHPRTARHPGGANR